MSLLQERISGQRRKSHECCHHAFQAKVGDGTWFRPTSQHRATDAHSVVIGFLRVSHEDICIRTIDVILWLKWHCLNDVTCTMV